MTRLVSALTIVIACVLAGEVHAAILSAPAMYADAQAKERAVRRVLEKGRPDQSVARAVRTVLRSYEALVRQYPASGYCDDALWNAARLGLDAWKRLNEPAFATYAALYLKRLTSGYPSSKHVKPASSLLADLDRSAASTSDATRPAVAVPEPAPPVTPPPSASVAQAAPAAPGRASASGTDSPGAPVATAGVDPEPAGAAAGDVAGGAAVRSGDVPVAATGGTSPAETPDVESDAGRERPLTTLTAIRREVLPDVVRVTLELDAEASFHQEELTRPDRLFFDFADTTASRELRNRSIRFDGDRDVVRQVRVGRQPEDTTRVVLETDGASCSAVPMYSPYRLVVDCVRTAPGRVARESTEARPTPRTPGTFARKIVTAAPPAPPEPLVARRLVSPMAVPPLLAAHAVAPLLARGLPNGRPHVAPTEFEAAVAAMHAPPPPPPVAAVRGPAVADAPVPATPAAPPVTATHNLDGGLSVARQLGLSVSRIVIDPGHGGHDPGARGRGVSEAELVLDIALRLEALLKAEPGVDVILTRRSDTFVPLEERTAIANREAADLFLSIHANASRAKQAGGVETYFLNFADTPGAAAVAARENAASGKPMSALPDVVRTIALNTKVDESRDVATLVQRALVQRLRTSHKGLRDLGVKQAPFVVLIGAAMPSVLTEVSFITNDREARLLKGDTYRQRIAEALFAAIQKYQASLPQQAHFSTHQ